MIAGSIELVVLVCTKGIPALRGLTARAQRGLCYLALTFGTLLSSQGTSAHRPRPLGLFGGNPFILPGPLRPTKSVGLVPEDPALRAYQRLWLGLTPRSDLGGSPASQSVSPAAREKLRGSGG